MMRHRRLLARLLVLFLIIIGIYGASDSYRRRDYRPEFVSRKGQLISAKETLLRSRPADDIVQIELENDKGLRIEGYLSIPSLASGPYPAVIALGGLGTGKRVLDYVENTGGLAMLAIDYPYEGKTKKLSLWEFLRNAPDMRTAIINTIPAAMLCVDYLEARNDIDHDRIVLVGGSLGALFAPAIAASDPRISAVALLFGGGDLQSLFRANIGMPEPIASVTSWALAILVSPVEPLKYVDRISPRPFFMLNGTGDTRVPSRCSKLLYNKAGRPKTSVWIPAEHVHVNSPEFRDRVRRELETWLEQNGILSPTSLCLPQTYRASYKPWG